MNNCIVPDMVLVDSPSNPHRSDLQYWRYIPDVVVDMLISAALTHQVIRCQATQDGFKLPIVQNSKVALSPHRMASFHNPAITQIYTHQRRTLQAVSEVLDDPELRYSDIVLAVVVMLIRVEVSAYCDLRPINHVLGPAVCVWGLAGPPRRRAHRRRQARRL